MNNNSEFKPVVRADVGFAVEIIPVYEIVKE